MAEWHFIEKSFIITLPSSWYDINNVERDIKHQIIIMSCWHFLVEIYVFIGGMCIFQKLQQIEKLKEQQQAGKQLELNQVSL